MKELSPRARGRTWKSALVGLSLVLIGYNLPHKDGQPPTTTTNPSLVSPETSLPTEASYPISEVPIRKDLDVEQIREGIKEISFVFDAGRVNEIVEYIDAQNTPEAVHEVLRVAFQGVGIEVQGFNLMRPSEAQVRRTIPLDLEQLKHAYRNLVSSYGWMPTSFLHTSGVNKMRIWNVERLKEGGSDSEENYMVVDAGRHNNKNRTVTYNLPVLNAKSSREIIFHEHAHGFDYKVNPHNLPDTAFLSMLPPGFSYKRSEQRSEEETDILKAEIVTTIDEADAPEEFRAGIIGKLLSPSSPDFIHLNDPRRGTILDLLQDLMLRRVVVTSPEMETVAKYATLYPGTDNHPQQIVSDDISPYNAYGISSTIPGFEQSDGMLFLPFDYGGSTDNVVFHWKEKEVTASFRALRPDQKENWRDEMRVATNIALKPYCAQLRSGGEADMSHPNPRKRTIWFRYKLR